SMYMSMCFCCLYPSFSSTSSLSLHDALPIFKGSQNFLLLILFHCAAPLLLRNGQLAAGRSLGDVSSTCRWIISVYPVHFLPVPRSEEHTSELQSRFDLVCRLLL